LATWLHRIAVNLARNRYWYFFPAPAACDAVARLRMSDESAATFADLIASTDPSPAQASASGEFTAQVAACMEKLDPSHREILTLRNVLHRSYEEIAATLGINVGTVKSRIARARSDLRAALAANCPEFSPEADLAEWFEPVRESGRLAVACA
jgi:RNA polymerase sigma-70 factor (ECF subfamily)